MIETIDDLFQFWFSPEKWLVIIDEVGLNNNARRSMSEGNLEFGRLWMLGRKLNVDIIMIAQLEQMNDSYFRNLATYTFEVSSHYCSPPAGVIWEYLNFEVKVKNRFWTMIKKFEIDLIKLSEELGFSYNTLDQSKIDRKKTLKIESFV